MNWNQLGRSLKSSLGAVFSSPKLEAACLRGIVAESPAQLLSLFSEATSLKELSISRVHFTQGLNPTPWPESQPWHPQLQSLLVSDVDSDNLCRYLLHPRIDLGHIRSLTIATEINEWRERLALAAISSTTQHLALYEPHWAGTTFKSILTPTLHSISCFSWDLLRLIPALFEACPHDSRLETIVFESHIDTFRAVRQYKDYFLPINAVIEAAMVHLSALKSVEIRVFAWVRGSYYSYPFREWAADIRAALPSLVGRGLLILTEIMGPDGNLHYGWE
ncbi:hypothetical protein MSAN_00653700 [Mycena sanguinolenta]|uniref:Uncharacterized protein n=1 Tax=Mycena sanguinolenta TaxID=230812 RepID=A0A8H6Z3D1_9AGAR|nr:hypothetical protein MSAN_00653700 [Mycena sanguinolenta]